MAAGGTSADQGLQGLTNEQSLSKLLGSGAGLSSDAQERQRQIHERLLGGSIWTKKAWNLQELVFSRRAVFIFESTITWQCHCATWNVETPGLIRSPQAREPCQEVFSEDALGLQTSPYPDLEEYARILYRYSGRELTYQEDIARDFPDIASTFARSFEGGFI